MPLHSLEGELSHGRERLQPKKDPLHRMRLWGEGVNLGQSSQPQPKGQSPTTQG